MVDDPTNQWATSAKCCRNQIWKNNGLSSSKSLTIRAHLLDNPEFARLVGGNLTRRVANNLPADVGDATLLKKCPKTKIVAPPWVVQVSPETAQTWSRGGRFGRGQFCARFGRVRQKFPAFRPNSAELGQRPISNQKRSKLAHTWPKLGRLRAKLGRSSSIWAEDGPIEARCLPSPGQIWPMPAELALKLVTCCPTALARGMCVHKCVVPPPAHHGRPRTHPRLLRRFADESKTPALHESEHHGSVANCTAGREAMLTKFGAAEIGSRPPGGSREPRCSARGPRSDPWEAPTTRRPRRPGSGWRA